LIPPAEPSEEIVESAASVRLARERAPNEPWRALVGFRLNSPPHVHVRLESGDIGYQVELDANSTAALPARDFGEAIVVFAGGNSYTFTDPKLTTQVAGLGSGGRIVSPMPGRIVAVLVQAGDRVAKGQPVVILEAMKMEHTLAAPFRGAVTAISAIEGNQVSEGVTLARIDSEE
jgi:3-methylcrotonyl-CoA carboxylase alpha subunit